MRSCHNDIIPEWVDPIACRSSLGTHEAFEMTRALRRGGSSQGEFVMNRRTFLKGAAAIGLGATTFQPASAQSFPAGVIRIVVPGSASTPPDILARIVASALADGEGWKVRSGERRVRKEWRSRGAPY